MESRLLNNDPSELADSMEAEEALRSRAGALEDELGSPTIVYAARRAIFRATNANSDLDRAIQAAELLSSSPLSGGVERVIMIAQLQEDASGLARNLFERTLEKVHLNRALALIQAAVQSTRDNGGYAFARRARHLTEISREVDFVTQLQGGQRGSNGPEISVPDWLNQFMLVSDGRNVNETAASMNRSMIADLADSNWLKFVMRCSLRNIRSRLFAASQTEANLRAAILAAEDVVAASKGQNAAQKPEALISLGNLVEKLCGIHRYQRESDLNYGIKCFEEANSGLKAPHRQRLCFISLSDLLDYRFMLTNKLQDIQESLAMAERALRLAPDSGVRYDIDRANCLHAVSHKLSHLHMIIWHGKIKIDREEELALVQRELNTAKEALELLPPDDELRRAYGTRCAASYRSMFKLTANREFLDQGIELCDSLSRLPEVENQEENSEYWTTLASLLQERYIWSESKKDVADAVIAGRKALDALDESHPVYAGTLANLAKLLLARSKVGNKFPDRYGAITAQRRKDLDEATELIEKSVDLTPPKSRQRSSHLDALATLRMERALLFSSDQLSSELDSCLDLAKEAVTLRPQDQFLRHTIVRLYALKAGSDSGPSKAQFFTAAAQELRTLLRNTPDADPDKAQRFSSLGYTLEWLFNTSQSEADLDGAIDAFESCWKNNATDKPSLRVGAAMQAATLLVRHKADFQRADGLLRGAVAQLRRVSPRSLRQADQQLMMRKFAGLATLAAATALQEGAEPGDALTLLEEGRGVILGLLFEMRSDVAALSSHPNYAADAAEFERLRDALDTPDLDRTGVGAALTAAAASLSSPSMAGVEAINSFPELTRRMRLAEELDVLIKKIQGYKGLEDFMQTPRVAELQRVAEAGSVVALNVSEFRCDALVVYHDRDVDLVPLPGLKMAEIKRWSVALQSKSITEAEMFKLLAWLWDELALPVLNRLEEVERDRTTLGENGDKADLPRVWWIPTGPLCSLPIHAAGHYGNGASPDETLLERVLSSYSPSIKALQFAQRNRQRGAQQALRKEDKMVTVAAGAPDMPSPKALVVAMEMTDGQAKLEAAKTEAMAVRKALLSKPLTQSTANTTAMATIDVPDVLVEPDRGEVIEQLRSASLLHFAGHGRSDAIEPLQSALLLKDWRQAPLTVVDLMDEFRQHERTRFLAYLSACSTGSSRDAQLADEGLHLMSAFQLAGFQHVIGSLWEVLDHHCVEVARHVYSTLAREGYHSDEAVVRGLHSGVRALRDLRRIGAGVDVTRSGHSLSGAMLKSQFWHGGDPRLWAAYIHTGL